ncbi:MAG: PhnD/SsuA/transferrin family substrate-binding protein [Hydrogenophilales bacterium]|nr:PhnD/SsuA/transferrin family substrate-binding protein [Hydrogenophilales bacterium]
MTGLGRALLGWLLALESALLAWPADAEETVRLGSYTLRREWSRAEVRGTYELWAQELARKFRIPVTITQYEDVGELRRDFLSGKINGINTDAMTFVRNFRLEELAEGYRTVMKGGWNLKLYAGREAPIRNFADLAGKRIAVLEENDVGDLYLETLCLRHHALPCKDVFADIQRTTTNNQALLRVFFGKADLALVHGYGYEVAVEMNPKLAPSLRQIDEHPIPSLYYAFYSAKSDKALREHTLRIIPSIHTYPRGRQLLDIFKMERLELAEPSELKPFQQLDRDYRELKARALRGGGRK